MKFLPVFLIFLCSFCLNAQNASLEETVEWINSYGDDLLKKGDRNYRNVTFNYQNNGFSHAYTLLADSGGTKTKISQTSIKLIPFDNLKSVTAFKDDYSNNIYVSFLKEIESTYEDFDQNKTSKGSSFQAQLEFYSTEDMLRYYKALKHLFELKCIMNTTFKENVTLENKF